MFRGNHNFGDSDQTKPNTSEIKNKYSNHIFNAAGENYSNVQYYSDSESSASSRNNKTRYINSAVCVETLDTHSSQSATSLVTDASSLDEITPHPHTGCKSNSTPFLTGRLSNGSYGSVKRKSCRLESAECAGDATPRCDLTYREDGPDTFRLSVASISTDTTAKEEREHHELKKQEAFRAWLERKEQEKREKARREKLKQQQYQPVTTSQQREESYRRWLEQKRTQDERKRAEEILRRYRQNEQLEQERIKREREKEDKLNDWLRKKEEDIKLMKTREERRAARAALEEKRRRMKGEQAYRDWLRSSKNKPLPVPLNQGELSMRGSVSEMYINPVPWQSLT